MTAGAVLAAPAWAAEPPTPDPGWWRAEGPHFVVFGHGPQAEVRMAAERLEGFDGLLRTVHGRPKGEPASARKLTVYVVQDRDEFQRFVPGAWKDMVGIYTAGLDDIFAVSTTNPGGTYLYALTRQFGDPVMFHEYTHHFMLQYYASAYPAWLTEGYAEYFSTTLVPANGAGAYVGNGLPERTSYLNGRTSLIPLKDLLTRRVKDFNGPRQLQFYAQSWLLTHYIMDSPERRKSLAAFLAIRGGDPVANWNKTFGEMSPKQEAQLWTRYFGSPEFKAGTGAVARVWDLPPVKVDALPLAQSVEMVATVAMKFGARPRDPAATLEVLRKLAKDMPGDEAAQLTYARAEIAFGQRDAGEKALQQIIAKNAKAVEARLRLAESLMASAPTDPGGRRAVFRKAGELLSQAAAIDPDNYQVLYNYAQSRTVEADYPSENTLNALLKAVYLAPQVQDIRLVAGEAALKRGRTDVAWSMWVPVATDVHGGPRVAKAQELLARLPTAGAGGTP